MNLFKRVNHLLSMMLFLCPGIMRVGGSASANKIPEFTYLKADGITPAAYSLLNDEDGNWRIKFLESGTLRLARAVTIDVFAVGGGGGVPSLVSNYVHGCGGGGYTATFMSIVLQADTPYLVVVGAGGAVNGNGGKSWAISEQLYYANGGYVGARVSTSSSGRTGGNGGSGGASSVIDSRSINGGVDGSNGSGHTSTYSYTGGIGQGTTTREFGEADGDLYAAGGGINSIWVENTGNGARAYSQSGCSGIVVMRNHRAA